MDNISLDGFPVLSLIFLALAVAAFVFALVRREPKRAAISWGVGFAAWVAGICTGGYEQALLRQVVEWALLGLPLAALVAASWRLPRARRDTITAEIGLLAMIALGQQAGLVQVP